MAADKLKRWEAFLHAIAVLIISNEYDVFKMAAIFQYGRHKLSPSYDIIYIDDVVLKWYVFDHDNLKKNRDISGDTHTCLQCRRDLIWDGIGKAYTSLP